jgi:hypothetical protein
MQYLKYTYVDSVTGVSITDAPAANGPVPPAIAGLDFDFALESQYPTNVPIFFGTAPDEADVIVDGVLDVLDHAAYESARAAELEARKAIKHRLRVLALENAREAGFQHNGLTIASDEKSQSLFNALNTEAGLALLAGTQEALDAFAAGLGSGWRATDGTVVATDAASFRAMMQSWYTHVATTDAVSQGHKTMINAAADLSDLQGIDVTDGY